MQYSSSTAEILNSDLTWHIYLAITTLFLSNQVSLSNCMILCTKAECDLPFAPKSKPRLLNRGNKSRNNLHSFFIFENSHCNNIIWLLFDHHDIKTPQLEQIDGSDRTKHSGTKSIKTSKIDLFLKKNIYIFNKISDSVMLHYCWLTKWLFLDYRFTLKIFNTGT